MALAAAAPELLPGLPSLPTKRSIEDVIAERIRVRLGRTDYILPVLTTGENADWWASLDAAYSAILADVDREDLEAMMEAVGSFGPDRLLDFIYSYDTTEVLPRTDEFRRSVYPGELLMAVWEVRLAANPMQRFAFNSAVTATVDEMEKQAHRRASTTSSRGNTGSRSKRSGTR
jgi:hypothetical protein